MTKKKKIKKIVCYKTDKRISKLLKLISNLTGKNLKEIYKLSDKEISNIEISIQFQPQLIYIMLFIIVSLASYIILH